MSEGREKMTEERRWRTREKTIERKKILCRGKTRNCGLENWRLWRGINFMWEFVFSSQLVYTPTSFVLLEINSISFPFLHLLIFSCFFPFMVLFIFLHNFDILCSFSSFYFVWPLLLFLFCFPPPFPPKLLLSSHSPTSPNILQFNFALRNYNKSFPIKGSPSDGFHRSPPGPRIPSTNTFLTHCGSFSFWYPFYLPLAPLFFTSSSVNSTRFGAPHQHLFIHSPPTLYPLLLRRHHHHHHSSLIVVHVSRHRAHHPQPPTILSQAAWHLAFRVTLERVILTIDCRKWQRQMSYVRT